VVRAHVLGLSVLVIGSVLWGGRAVAQDPAPARPEKVEKTALDALLGDGWREVGRSNVDVHGEPGYSRTLVNAGRTICAVHRLDGSLLYALEDSTLEQVPADLREKASELVGGGDILRQQIWLQAFACEDHLADGTERVRLFDPFGHLLCQFSEVDDQNEDEGEIEDEATEETAPGVARRLEFDDLPEVVRVHLAAHLSAGAMIREVEYEQEWGLPVYTIAFKDRNGRQEIKLREDGEILFRETAYPRELPGAIVKLARDSEVDRLLLRLFLIESAQANGAAKGLLLTGRIVALPHLPNARL